MKKLEIEGAIGLAFWNNGFRVMSANRPIHTPAEMKGLKMRINSSKVNAAIMKSVGAVPQTMAFSEVYQGLQTGVIDGTEGPLSNLYTQKQYEVQKHVTLTYHTISNYVVVANKPFWDKLPPEVRTDARGRDQGRDCAQRRDVRQGRGSGDRRHQGVGQERDLHADAGREGAVGEGDAAGPGRDGVARKEGNDFSDPGGCRGIREEIGGGHRGVLLPGERRVRRERPSAVQRLVLRHAALRAFPGSPD